MRNQTTVDDPQDLPLPADVPVPEIDEVLEGAIDALKNAIGTEESRFNNLNSRAVALLAASSIVLSLAGLFAKNLTDGSMNPIRPAIAALLSITVLSLLLLVWTVVRLVLWPRPRYVFGDNKLTNDPGGIRTVRELNEIVFRDYFRILDTLTARNKDKGAGMNLSYLAFGLSLLLVAIQVIVVSCYVYNLPTPPP